MNVRLPFQQKPSSLAGTRSGAVLLEVVLALVLFVVAASIITLGMNSAVDSLERLRLNTHALNLATSVLAELQMGALPIEAAGPVEFDPPFSDWTWEIQSEDVPGEIGDTNLLTRVEVVIRHTQQPIVRRLTQVMHIQPAETGTYETSAF